MKDSKQERQECGKASFWRRSRMFPAPQWGRDWRTYMENYFEGFDFTDFWDDSDYAEKEYIGAA